MFEFLVFIRELGVKRLYRGYLYRFCLKIDLNLNCLCNLFDVFLIDVYLFIDFLFNSISICIKNSLNFFIIEIKVYLICNTFFVF